VEKCQLGIHSSVKAHIVNGAARGSSPAEGSLYLMEGMEACDEMLEVEGNFPSVCVFEGEKITSH